MISRRSKLRLHGHKNSRGIDRQNDNYRRDGTRVRKKKQRHDIYFDSPTGIGGTALSKIVCCVHVGVPEALFELVGRISTTKGSPPWAFRRLFRVVDMGCIYSIDRVCPISSCRTSSSFRWYAGIKPQVSLSYRGDCIGVSLHSTAVASVRLLCSFGHRTCRRDRMLRATHLCQTAIAVATDLAAITIRRSTGFNSAAL